MLQNYNFSFNFDIFDTFNWGEKWQDFILFHLSYVLGRFNSIQIHRGLWQDQGLLWAVGAMLVVLVLPMKCVQTQLFQTVKLQRRI